VRDFTAPTMEQFKEFLEIMNKAEVNVVIHCQGGSGRTGTMGAAYWIAKGMSAHKAIDKVRQANPGAIEEHEQEESLYELVSILSEFAFRSARQTASKPSIDRKS
jgi:atypical dual specificity phosphatase